MSSKQKVVNLKPAKTGNKKAIELFLEGKTDGTAITISATNGGIDITSLGNTAGDDIDITATTSINLTANEDIANTGVIPLTTTVSDLAVALNEMGLKPRDIIAIFQSIKHAGALNAKLIIL